MTVLAAVLSRALHDLARDLLRLLSTPGPISLAICMVMSAVAGTFAAWGLGSNTSESLSQLLLPTLAAALGCVAFGQDLRLGTLHLEVVQLGGRTRQWCRAGTALCVTAGVAGGLSGLAATLSSFAVGVRSPLFGAMIAAAFSALVWALFGAFATSIIGNLAGSLVGVFCYLTFVEPIVEGGVRAVEEWLPARNTAEVLLAPSRDALPVGPALHLLMVVVVAGSASLIIARRRSIPVTAT